MTRSKLAVSLGLAAALTLGLAMAPEAAFAQPKGEICDNGIDDDDDKAVDCEDPDCEGAPACSPKAETICHNIGGAENLGANCDPETGECTVTEEDTGRTFTVGETEFFGIEVGTSSPGALRAHIRHGDGPTLVFIDPPLHLSSQGDNHRAANVDCIGMRINEQPDEPGN